MSGHRASLRPRRLDGDVLRELAPAGTVVVPDVAAEADRPQIADEAKTALASKGAAVGTIATYETLMQRCDFVRFAGLSASALELKSDMDSAEKLLEQLDRELG